MLLILLNIAVLAVATTVAGALMYWVHARRKPAALPGNAKLRPPDGPVFLFQGDDLIDTTPAAQQMIAPFGDMSDRDAMLHVLGPHFPGLASQLLTVDVAPCRIGHQQQDHIWIDLDRPNGQIRVAVTGLIPAGASADQFSSDLQAAELALLREVTNHAPQLIWRTKDDGSVSWANQAYLNFWEELNPDSAHILPEKIMFPALCSKIPAASPSVRRVVVPKLHKAQEHWFDVSSVCQDTAALHFATDANAVVRADQERRNFVQTLGKTFAELSIGLAIFDKRRQLATFNPALLDMTRLGFDFLSARPTIDTVLDRLRETRILPEPKNYASWRDQFTAVETAAKNGTYSEVWNLPDGQAFRVTGRPHPDGAFAFLFEDITADLSLTRRFRADIETGQAVLDALPDALAVFSTAGTLIMYNRAYVRLWGMQAEHGLEHRALGSEMAIWQERCAPATNWTDLQHFVQQLGPRKPWSDDALLVDGQLVRCNADPIAGGMTMVRFSLVSRRLPVLRKLTQTDPAIRSLKR